VWRVAHDWGSTAAERDQSFPCDDLLKNPDDVLFRAIDVDAVPAVTFRWLCQLRTAPYSYDWIDNLGRTSPRTLTPGLELLAVGQTVMTIFELVDFENPLTSRSGTAAGPSSVISPARIWSRHGRPSARGSWSSSSCAIPGFAGSRHSCFRWPIWS